MADGQRLRDRVVPFRFLIAVILVWGLVRLVVVLVAPAEVSIFAPDEGAYTDIIGFVKSGGDWSTYQSGYGSGFWPQGRALLVPGLGLMYVGLEAIDALRIVSVIYSTGSALLLLTILWIAMRHGRYPDEAAGPKLISWPTLGLAVFLFLPSHTLWNTLALREAATEFWVLAAVTLTAVLFAVPIKWWQKVVVGVGIALSVAMTYQSRGYMAVALSLALAAGVVWFGRERPRFSVTLAGAAIAGTVLGVTLSMPVPVPSVIPPTPAALAQAEALKKQAQEREQQAEEKERELREVSSLLEELKDTSDADPANVAKVKAAEATRDRLQAEAAAAIEAATTLQEQAEALATPQPVPVDRSPTQALQYGVGALDDVVNPDVYLERGSYQREVSAQYANSAIATDSCAGVPDPRSLRLCEITRLPGAAFAVMFRPIWPLDTPAQWSGLALAASIENVAWLALAIAVIYVLAARRSQLTRVLWICLAYGGLLIAGMAALEGNFGTAFRHKSNVLWVLALVLVLVGTRRIEPRVDRAALLHRPAEASTDSVARVAQPEQPPASV